LCGTDELSSRDKICLQIVEYDGEVLSEEELGSVVMYLLSSKANIGVCSLWMLKEGFQLDYTGRWKENKQGTFLSYASNHNLGRSKMKYKVTRMIDEDRFLYHQQISRERLRAIIDQDDFSYYQQRLEQLPVFLEFWSETGELMMVGELERCLNPPNHIFLTTGNENITYRELRSCPACRKRGHFTQTTCPVGDSFFGI